MSLALQLRTAKEILEEVKQQLSEKQEGTTKRKRKESSPPRRPMTAYFLFWEEKRPRMMSKYPGYNAMQLTKKMSKRWGNLSEERKENYRQIYRENREIFEKEMTEYLCDKHPEERRPRSSLELWSLEKAPEIKSSHPDITSKKLDKKLKKYWEQLDDKQEWERKSKKESQRFLKKMEKRARGKNYK